MKRPTLVHVSTCFVAGNRSGAVWESDSVLGYFPRKSEMPGVEFSVDQEIADCAKLADRVREEARDAMMTARFRELARKRLSEEGRDSDDPDALGLAVARERKVWTQNTTRLILVSNVRRTGAGQTFTRTPSRSVNNLSPQRQTWFAVSCDQASSNPRCPIRFRVGMKASRPRPQSSS